MAALESFHHRLVTDGPKGAAERLIFALLVLLSRCFAGLSWLRNLLYQKKLLPAYMARLPVISVGNLAVGGTGKTPVVDHLLGWFAARGVKVAVISRGYGGNFVGRFAMVSSGEGGGPLRPASSCGDEPFLLAQRNPHSRVYVARKRRHALQHLEQTRLVDLVILDDGFQHRQVARDLDVVLLDDARPYGNGYLLPAGILREGPSALQRADLLVLTRAEPSRPVSLVTSTPHCRCAHRLGAEVVAIGGGCRPLAELRRRKGVAFAGIADPGRFFELLVVAGVELVVRRPFADHCSYTQREIAMLEADAADADFLLTTEKDAVKLAGFQFRKPCYIVKLEIDFFEGAALDNALYDILGRIEHAQSQ
ncbi:MAG: tetraacyldisaccharide 4'-kinase [Desulfuromonas sp.]|nr:MAG: tetraacyldisaccharide 4'-kinase [Desulfuromonas sp.]